MQYLSKTLQELVQNPCALRSIDWKSCEVQTQTYEVKDTSKGNTGFFERGGGRDREIVKTIQSHFAVGFRNTKMKIKVKVKTTQSVLLPSEHYSFSQ